ncbi:MAG: sugar nucleotide-binding protein [Planctomycetota bacterium]|nr:sugar nucleotide-binding protein [Planctomycetota bacterium]
MNTLIIAGVDTVVGANLAIAFSDPDFAEPTAAGTKTAATCRVIGLSFSSVVSIPGVECLQVRDAKDDAVRRLFSNPESTRVLLCGAAAVSCWHQQPSPLQLTQQLERDRSFAELAAEFGCPLTAITSDAVFSGPWVFHDEDSESLCSSHEAELIRRWETEVADCHADALIVRTNAIGWSPTGDGLLESLIRDLETGEPVMSHGGFASPVVAGDLAPPLLRAWREAIRGVIHIAGTERMNPAAFADRIAFEFDLPKRGSFVCEQDAAHPTGFGQGETSLQTVLAQRWLAVKLPTISEGARRLFEQSQTGFRDRLRSSTPSVEQVA